MSLKSARRLSAWTAVASLLLAVGCAQQVGDIDRTSPNALRKADFTDGEWYIRQTIVEVPPAAFAGFVGLTGELDKIRWEITESYLIAYRSYEHNPGTHTEATVDGNGEYTYLDHEQEGYGEEFKESAIAAYPIVSHFDIQRQYNASTGEQSNVIVENSSDNHWYETEYFRVDWTNALTTYQMFDNAFYAGINWYVQPSEESLDSLVMEYFNRAAPPAGVQGDDYAQGELYYMDFTNRVVLDPDYTYCFGGFLPQALDDCAASEVELRTSVLRVPRLSDYEPVMYDDNDMQKFGYFRTDRVVYDRRYGERLSNVVQLANRHNIWRGS
jgi:hypothetical protein